MTDILHAFANESGLVELVGAVVLTVAVTALITLRSWIRARAVQRHLAAERRRYARLGS